LSADKFALSVEAENETWRVAAREKCSFAHFSSPRNSFGRKSTRKIDQRAVGSIIKRPFIIQVIIKIVCVYSLCSLLRSLRFCSAKPERNREKDPKTQT
jgi:hypothetical protein